MGTESQRLSFGVSQFTTMPWSFEQDVDHYHRLGVDAIEVCEVKLDPHRVANQLGLVDQAGLRVTSFQPAVRTIFPSMSQPEPRSPQDRVNCFRESIELLGKPAAGLTFVANTGPPPDFNIAAAFDACVVHLGLLADLAAEHGARVALEPLNPSLENLESAIWTVDQARDIVEAAARENLGLCIDFWNVWQNPGVEEAIAACGDRIFVVHVSDWRMPRSQQDRVIPGEGAIPLQRLMAATRRAGFEGPYVLEIFSSGVPDSLWEGKLDDLLDRSRRGMEAAWAASAPALAVGRLS